MQIQLHPSPRGMEFANFLVLLTDLEADPSVQLDLIEPAFLERLERLEQEFAPIIEPARQFDLLERHLPHRILHLIDLAELQTEDDYLRLCRQLSDDDIREMFAQGLQRALQLSHRPDLLKIDFPSIMTTLERLQIEGEAKWKIVSLLHDPIGKFHTYLELLEQLKQPFARYYAEVADQVAEYQAAFERQLSQGHNPLHLIMDLTFREADQLTDKPIVVYPLGINRYLLSVHELPESRFISLGIGLEEYQTRIKQSQSHSRDARINALRSLGDKTRYELMRLLAERLSNKELAERLNVTSPNISYHIKTLLNENLIVLEILDNKSYPVVNKTILTELLADIALDFELDEE